jgi:hypothetical protein
MAFRKCSGTNRWVLAAHQDVHGQSVNGGEDRELLGEEFFADGRRFSHINGLWIRGHAKSPARGGVQ